VPFIFAGQNSPVKAFRPPHPPAPLPQGGEGGANAARLFLALASYLQFVYTFSMAITKVFRSGNSQAVRIPRKFRFRSQQVEITKRGDEIVLRERRGDLSAAFELLTSLSPDFFKGGRCQPKLDKRLGL